jgi:drug/metabolite transporter (DMT)-like permease
MSHDKHANRLKLGIGIALVAYLFFATASSLVWNFRGRFPTIQIIFIQNVVSFFCILPLALRKGWDRMKTNELPSHLIRDLFGLVSYYLYFLAIRFLNLVDATTLNYTAPFFVPIVWWIWQKEKIDHRVWWSIVIGFFGVAFILNPSRDIFQIGFVFGIFAGITSAIAQSSIRVLNLKREPMTRTLFYFFSISSLLSFPFAWASWVPPVGYEWLLAILIGVATAFGQIFLTIAYRHGTAAYLSPLGYSVVIYNGLISFFLFQRPIGWRSIVGTILIILGGTLTYLWKRKPHSIQETFEIPPKEKTKL